MIDNAPLSLALEGACPSARVDVIVAAVTIAVVLLTPRCEWSCSLHGVGVCQELAVSPTLHGSLSAHLSGCFGSVRKVRRRDGRAHTLPPLQCQSAYCSTWLGQHGTALDASWILIVGQSCLCHKWAGASEISVCHLFVRYSLSRCCLHHAEVNHCSPCR